MNPREILILMAVLFPAMTLTPACGPGDMLRGSAREDRDGWLHVHLEGTSREIGYQHGWLLADEIDDVLRTLSFYLERSTGRDWNFYRGAAERMFWPKLERPLQMEIEGIAEGLQNRRPGLRWDRFDLTALNGWIELAWYYVPLLNAGGDPSAAESKAPPSCSAFIATGSYTKDGRIVMAHNTWVEYIIGGRWNAILDIAPETGHRILMDAIPGYVHSGDDFVLNGAGILYTETTIAKFRGFSEDGVPVFARARKAAQAASSIDDFIRIMTTDGNGAYANDWLVGDLKTNEIARLELGLRNQRVWRSFDGYFAGSNFPLDEKLIAEETTFDSGDASLSVFVRKSRWETLMEENRGAIDAEAAMAFLGDHIDASTGEPASNGNVLCGHVHDDPKGLPEFGWAPHFPGGAVQGKATTAALAGEMKFWARMGHPCGAEFLAAPFLASHPEWSWQAPYLRDLATRPWSLFGSRTP